MIKYYIGDILFCECVEGSMMDRAIQAMQKEGVVKRTKELQSIIMRSLPMQIPKVKESRDILTAVKAK